MNDFNPLKLIEDAVKAGFDPGTVTDLDEKQVPWAKNVFEWITSSSFLDIKSVFPLQLQMALRLFGDVCPYCSDWEFYTKDFDVNLTSDKIQERLQFLEFGQCPVCKKNRLDHYNESLWMFPDEINLLWGMRASKSALCGGMISTYVLHRFLSLPEPAVYFGLLKGQELYMRFVAMSLRQAKQSNWMHFQSRIMHAPWFRQYHDLMDYYSQKKGFQYVHWLGENFAYIHKGIVGYCVGSSNDRERGRTAAHTNIDEIGLFNPDEDARDENAPETYATYQQASATVRAAAMKRFLGGDYNAPTAWMTVQSSTISKMDYIVKLIKQNRSDPGKVTSHKASWEVNPDLTEAVLLPYKRKDPKKFLRDFGSEPPFADDPFIDSEEMVLKTTKLEIPRWQVSLDKSTIGPFFNAENVPKSRTIPYLLSIDMGRTDCGYALTLLKLKEDDFSVVQTAGIWALYPRRGEGVDFDGMFNSFIVPMCERINVRLVVFDQWQSAYQIDALKKMGIQAEQYSLTYKDFLAYRSGLYQEKIENCVPEMKFKEAEASNIPLEEILQKNPYLHLLWQTLSVKEVGSRIIKGTGYDDIFRAYVLGATFLWNDKYRPWFEYRGTSPLRFNNRGGGLVLAGGSRIGGSYATSHSHLSNVITSNNKVLGVFVPRTKK